MVGRSTPAVVISLKEQTAAHGVEDIVEVRVYMTVLRLAMLSGLACAVFPQSDSAARQRDLGVYFVNYKGGVSPGWVFMQQPSASSLTLARTAKISGEVVVRVTVAEDGTVARLDCISGNPLLIPATMEALKFWRRKPRELGDSSTKLIETITFEFRWSPTRT